MSRAKKTAEIIGQVLGLPVEVLPVLGDYGFGEWEGKTPEEVKQAYPEQYRLWFEQPDKARIPGGDNLAERRTQVDAALDSLAAERPDQTIVLVSHRIVSKIIALSMLGLDNSHLWNVDVDTGSISVFERKRFGWLTQTLNDTCHLKQ